MRAVVSSKTPPISVRYKDSLKQILKIYLRFNPKDLGGRTRLVIVHALVWTFFFFFFVYICIYRRKAVFMNIKKKKKMLITTAYERHHERRLYWKTVVLITITCCFFFFFPTRRENMTSSVSLSSRIFSVDRRKRSCRCNKGGKPGGRTRHQRVEP